MIIGVDAGSLSVNDERLKVGVYQVTRYLLRELGRMDRKNQYRLYSFTPLDPELLREFGQNMENCVLTPGVGWWGLRLPVELRLNPVDVFIGLSQAIPGGGQRNIGLVYDLGFLHYPEAYPKSYEKLVRHTQQLIERSDQIISISEVTKLDVAQTYGVEASKIQVCHPGVDRIFTLKGEKHQHSNPYFLFVGSLKRQKNIGFLLRAFARFLETQSQIYDLLLVGGDYWLDPQIFLDINRLCLGNRVTRVGQILREDLPAYYRGAAAFVSPSLIEGFCLPAAEALASGAPIIVSRLPIFFEIAGSAGLFVDNKNEEELVAAMQTVVNDKKLRQTLVTKGLTRAKKYSWSKFARGVYETYA